jgi:hypothetical protein
MREPTRTEDATNLSLIGGATLVAAFLTLGLLAAPLLLRNRATVEVHPVVEVAPLVRVTPPAPPAVPIVITGTFEGDDRLYGTVIDRRGDLYTGYIRWDRNEGSWADLLDATKSSGRRGRTTAGIRFGHVHRIDVMGRRAAMFTLKSGERFELGANATDLGSGLRAIVVQGPDVGSAEFEWRDLDQIEFMPAPDGAEAAEQRIHGTLTTRSGLEFTGYVAWDRDEIYTTDVLDGEADGQDQEIAFGAISSIERQNSSSARVVLNDGREMILRGTNDVDDSNRGITVSDHGLGQVDLTWGEFESVRFHPPESAITYGQFDGGSPIFGTVVTESGDEVTGRIAWDRDESFTWEMLDGDSQGVDFSIEFGKIASIEKTGRGVEVTLRDGRRFALTGSNDVDGGNRGILVETDDNATLVDWSDFVELRLD